MNDTTCAREGCQNEAKWFPVMLLFAPPAKYPGSAPARSVCKLPLCDAHRERCTLEWLLTDEGWTQIATAFILIGRVVPERAATRITFIAIDSPEAQWTPLPAPAATLH